jgi:D-alanyl-D-alanine carboxypeptidase (penicillin-binding protein 5/6)
MKRFGCMLLAFVLLFGLAPVTAEAVELDVPGKSAVLMDVSTGTVLYESNAHDPLPPASVTKVMTMLLIMEAIDSGKIGWNDTVTTSEAAAAKGGSQVYLKVGETMSVTEMVKSIAVSSANDCACAMAEYLAGSESAFVELMNRRAGELGMKNTRFVNCTGLDDEDSAKDHVISAYDIALMSRQLLKYHPDITKFTTIWMDTIRGGSFGLSNTNKMVRFYPDCTGLKTGFTAQAGYCLSSSAKREGLELIAVVMGCETSAQRFAACRAMLDYGFANFALVDARSPENTSVPVKLGAADSVRGVPGADTRLLIDKSQKSSVTTRITLEPQLSAPVSKGQRIGEMTVYAGEQILAKVPLVAEEAVPRLGWKELFLRILRRIAMARE